MSIMRADITLIALKSIIDTDPKYRP